MKHLKTILCVISLLGNAVFIFIVISAFAASVSSLSFHDMNTETTPYTTAAALVSFPSETGSVVYGPVSITLATGDRAVLQISAVTGKRQANRLITALYDHSVISSAETGFGIVITALKAGTTVLQTLTEEGIVDIAAVTVAGPEE
jgi:hypothetical protein